MPIAEQFRERKLDRMRAGQAACDIVPLVSDPEIRVALVPLTEAEYLRSMEMAAALDVLSNRVALEFQERRQTNEILWAALRNPEDLSEHAWEDTSAMTVDLDTADINHLFDHYLEMVDQSSPSIDGIPEGEWDLLKKALQEIPWNELSGKQWYAAKRFLGSVFPTLLLDRSPGFSFTNQSTGMSDESEPASNVSQS